MRDMNAVTVWVQDWLRNNAGIDIMPDDALLGSVSSITIGMLTASAEERWDVDVSQYYNLAMLATVKSFANCISEISEPSHKTWYIASEVNKETLSGNQSLQVTRSCTKDGKQILGISGGDVYEEPLGSVTLIGEEAKKAYKLVEQLDTALVAFDRVPVWYPMLTNNERGRSHPQNVRASFSSGRLAHAACLQLLEYLPSLDNGLYSGLGYAYRSEPSRAWNPRGRLEAYRVYEIVWLGNREESQRAQDELMYIIDDILSDEIGKGFWDIADDGFTEGLTRKMEWILSDRDETIAIASINEHGQHFAGKGRYSFCIGVGIDRIVDLLEKNGEKNGI